ncbi:MAG: S8 family serine peptidase [Myxococcota bacterium]|nr:S8 family serine peptidase [Myxococcota bacterium]
MSELTVRAVTGTLLPPSPAPTPAVDTPALAVRSSDSIDENPRDYIVFGDVAKLTLRAPTMHGMQFRGGLSGSEPWSTARMTAAEAAELVAQGFQVHEDRPTAVAKTTPATGPVSDALANIHQAQDLNALGPEWQGEGGLFISLDSGVAPHRDLPPIERFDNVFTESPEDPPADPTHHGTHTTGSAIGRGDPAQGGVRGAAPRARLMAVQVLDDTGRGTESSTLRGLERAIEWARQHDGFVVINVSLSGSAMVHRDRDPLVQLIERATREHGILFSIAAGNEGPFPGYLGRLGLAPSAITVAAMDHNGTVDTTDDRIAVFSSRGNGWENKPNIAARGMAVRSTIPGDAYSALNGTSMGAGLNGGGVLALGQGLLAMYRRGELREDPRDLVRRNEFQRIVAEASFDNPRIASDREGSGDLRLMNAREMFLQRFATANTQGPAPYFPRHRMPPAALPAAGYQPPF